MAGIAPASAATNHDLGTADCSDSYPAEQTIYVLPGDTLTINWAGRVGGCVGTAWDPNFLTASGVDVRVMTVRQVEIGTVSSFQWFQNAGANLKRFVLIAGTPPAAELPAQPAPIPGWKQAYGRASADATCEDGWSPSWQAWAEPVTGGWVCTRTIPAYG